MAQFVYIDESGSNGQQDALILAAVMVGESFVQSVGRCLHETAVATFGKALHPKFEWHGRDVWHGEGPWKGISPERRAAAYASALDTLRKCNAKIVHASLKKSWLWGRARDKKELVALQLLLEKVDEVGVEPKVLVADRSREVELLAVRMVADMQEWGAGIFKGRRLETIIDSLHFVSSESSPGVQLADLAAFVLQRRRRKETDPRAQAVQDQLASAVDVRTAASRETWPSVPPPGSGPNRGVVA